ncbi:DegV family protein [Legionella spiritensis]|uniref:DegV family protein n=1 Tax=Legionella spiritensis TaxID=452 RepID=UPI000F71B3D6|nr:DegV family protein [Legionella spiritensis]VEG91647.1 DAK2 domain protein [Legionella spiritensis]
MALLQLDSGLLHSAVVHACYELVKNRETLNAINVFPVADGDTGNNMAATAKAIITYSSRQETLEDTCKSIADAGILGAHGNSGMIFSQFFNGLTDKITLPFTLSTLEFASMIANASTSVRAAIANPVEGTILTVMEAWAASLQQLAGQIGCFNQLMKQSIHILDEALQSTVNTLSLLKEANVVDAGALGFTFFVKGFAEFLNDPRPHVEKADFPAFEPHHDDEIVSSEPPQMRYCTEAMIAGENLDKSAVTSLVQAHGDSIVLTANARLCRLHIHCNKPWQVFSALDSAGKIQYPKVDDMLRQYETLHQRKHPIALVTDTGANIPQDIADHYQIHFIPFNIQVNGHDLLDRYGLDSELLYENLAGLPVYPTTSSPSPGIITEKLRILSRHYEHVLIVSVAQALSGTHDAIVQATRSFSNVHVINSRHVSGAQGLLLNHAAELIADGYSIEAIKEALQAKRSKTHMFVMVNQFDSLIRSGRVSKLKGKIAQFSQVKPILSLDPDGRVIIYDKTFSETKALVAMVQAVRDLSQPDGLDNYCIVHAGVPEKAREFAIMTTEAFGHEPAFIEPVSTGIGLHAGKGCLALAAMTH